MSRGEYIAAAILIGTVAICAMAMTAKADVIYSTAELESKYAPLPEGEVEVGIAPGSSESATQITTNSYEQLRTATKSNKQHEYSSISMTTAERDELRRVVAAESQNQSLEGRMAVVEVIFNRVLSSKWPNSVHGVLSQKGQFAGYRLRNAKWVEPQYADAAIDAVLTSGRTVLPSTLYVYFDTKGSNGSSHVKIGAHYFGR